MSKFVKLIFLFYHTGIGFKEFVEKSEFDVHIRDIDDPKEPKDYYKDD